MTGADEQRRRFEECIRTLFPEAWLNRNGEGKYWYPVIDDFLKVWQAAQPTQEQQLDARFLETERNNHRVSIMEWERCEAERDALQAKLDAMPSKCEEIARKIAAGGNRGEQFKEWVLEILRESLL